ncbi:hypothetical protein C8J56DRAFT_886661 [Mycena floridula]|nr:hypothetical protein C8J56DRAFT_886661 [Mycena floridula]
MFSKRTFIPPAASVALVNASLWVDVYNPTQGLAVPMNIDFKSIGVATYGDELWYPAASDVTYTAHVSTNGMSSKLLESVAETLTYSKDEFSMSLRPWTQHKSFGTSSLCTECVFKSITSLEGAVEVPMGFARCPWTRPINGLHSSHLDGGNKKESTDLPELLICNTFFRELINASPLVQVRHRELPPTLLSNIEWLSISVPIDHSIDHKVFIESIWVFAERIWACLMILSVHAPQFSFHNEVIEVLKSLKMMGVKAVIQDETGFVVE